MEYPQYIELKDPNGFSLYLIAIRDGLADVAVFLRGIGCGTISHAGISFLRIAPYNVYSRLNKRWQVLMELNKKRDKAPLPGEGEAEAFENMLRSFMLRRIKGKSSTASPSMDNVKRAQDLFRRCLAEHRDRAAIPAAKGAQFEKADAEMYSLDLVTAHQIAADHQGDILMAVKDIIPLGTPARPVVVNSDDDSPGEGAPLGSPVRPPKRECEPTDSPDSGGSAADRHPESVDMDSEDPDGALEARNAGMIQHDMLAEFSLDTGTGFRFYPFPAYMREGTPESVHYPLPCAYYCTAIHVDIRCYCVGESICSNCEDSRVKCLPLQFRMIGEANGCVRGQSCLKIEESLVSKLCDANILDLVCVNDDSSQLPRVELVEVGVARQSAKLLDQEPHRRRRRVLQKT
ncbi:hypothetical protein BJ166DRAFT_503682 [Pestalotiopsis sp. NC0098]|nr:hypothetical protein BJ166DRAFT_503682 [Pestalotiopsis sp. NC0098]